MATKAENEILAVLQNDLKHLVETTNRIEKKVDIQNGRIGTVETKQALLEAGLTVACKRLDALAAQEIPCRPLREIDNRLETVEKNQGKVMVAGTTLGAAAGVVGAWMKGLLS